MSVIPRTLVPIADLRAGDCVRDCVDQTHQVRWVVPRHSPEGVLVGFLVENRTRAFLVPHDNWVWMEERR